MPEVIETTVYTFEELDERAQERARDWYRQASAHDDWLEFVFEDFERICEILGVDLATRPVRLFGGGTRTKPCIWFSGFSSQGDGACFERSYSYRKGASRAIRTYAPRDMRLAAIADQLQQIQRQYFYALEACLTHRGRYYHEHSMEISVERNSDRDQLPTADAEEGVSEALRDLARWLYRQLEQEYDHQMSNEVVDCQSALNRGPGSASKGGPPFFVEFEASVRPGRAGRGCSAGAARCPEDRIAIGIRRGF